MPATTPPVIAGPIANTAAAQRRRVGEAEGGQCRHVVRPSAQVTGHRLRHDEQAGESCGDGGDDEGVALPASRSPCDTEERDVVLDDAILDTDSEVGDDRSGITSVVQVDPGHCGWAGIVGPAPVEQGRAGKGERTHSRIVDEVGRQPHHANDRDGADRFGRAVRVDEAGQGAQQDLLTDPKVVRCCQPLVDDDLVGGGRLGVSARKQRRSPDTGERTVESDEHVRVLARLSR